MPRRPVILMDFEEAFNSFSGIPLSVVNDALCLFHADADLILWYHNEKKTLKILDWMDEFFNEEQRSRIRLLPSRPPNFVMWIAQIFPRLSLEKTSCDFVYSRLFPHLPIKDKPVTLLRIDDPFGDQASFWQNFIEDFRKGIGVKNSLARSLRTKGMSKLTPTNTIKVFNSNWTLNLWNSIYRNVSARDLVIYPPVQFSIDDFFSKSKEITNNPSKRPYFVFIGGQRQRKDPLSIINLWASDLKKHNFDLVLIGDIPEHLMTENLRQAIFKGRFFILKNLSRNELRNTLESSAGVVFNSKGEGFGNPIAEAIYLKQNLICNDLEVFREVAGEYALYFQSGQSTQALRLLSDLSKSKQKRKSVKEAPNNYTISEAIERWQFIHNP